MILRDTMQAAYIEAPGAPEAIRVGALPIPAAGPTDVRVRLAASTVNHVDLLVRSGAYATHTPFPFVIGRDLVGTVIHAGASAGDFRPGDRVWCNSLGYAGRQGAFSEQVVVSADRLYPLPDGVPWAQAAVLLHPGATAFIGLVHKARLQAGETLLVEGAAGGVGSAVVQLATAMGARVIATAAPNDEAWCRACGAQTVIDYHDADCYAQVRAAAPEGLDVWWDASGHQRFEACLPLLRLHGRAIIMSGFKGAAPVLSVGPMYTHDVSLHGFAISNASVGDLGEAAAFINHFMATGRLRARIGATYPLSEAARAHVAQAQGGLKGRILILP